MPSFKPNVPKLPASVQWAILLLGSALALPLVLMVAYNLVVPLLHAPSMTYGEAVGIELLLGLLAGYITLLKETN